MKNSLRSAFYRLFFTAAIVIVFTAFGVSAQTTSLAGGLLQKFINLPAPAPLDPNLKKPAEKKERPKEFFDEDNPPPDDAPIEDLLAYWEGHSTTPFDVGYRPKPSAKTVERLLDYCEENPGSTPRFLSAFPPKPEVADVVKKIHDDLERDGKGERYRLVEWLKYNSKYYIDELLAAANQIKDESGYVQNPHQYILRALARVDWDAALPIITRLENDPSNPHSQILAKWVSYQHAVDTGDYATQNAYRHDLQKIVENSNASYSQRDLALDALTISPDWEGRDEWYQSLLEDEGLLAIQEHGYTGLTTLVLHSPKKKYREKMIELTKSSNLTVRSAAARNLLDIYKEGDSEIARALLPWLLDERWAKITDGGDRANLVKAFGETEVPESVPGLISVLQYEELYRDAAARALAKYKDPRAVPALHTVLATLETHDERIIYIGALVACGGFSDEQQMAALEAYAVMSSTEEGRDAIRAFEGEYDGEGDDHYGEEEEEPANPAAVEPKPLPLQISIGSFVAAQEEPGEGLVSLAVARIKILRKRNPPVAATLAAIMEKWKGPAMHLETMRRVRGGETTVDDLLYLLTNRREIREKLANELSLLRADEGVSRGIGACISEDEGEYSSILKGTEAEAQITMLGCARMLRAPLPVFDVAELLDSPNKMLAVAAERYLESEDGLDARKLVLARHKNEAMILGARHAFIPDTKDVYSSHALNGFLTSMDAAGFFDELEHAFRKKEDTLRDEMLRDPDMTAVFALLPTGEAGRKILRVYKTKAVYTFYEDPARYWEKALTAEEYEAFYQFVISNNYDALKTTLSCADHGCTSEEFVMFGRDGGRRVYYHSNRPVAAFEKLNAAFDSFMEGEEAPRLQYHLKASIPGLEVLWSDKNFPARAVWASGADVRFVAEDIAAEAEAERDLSNKIREAGADKENAESRVKTIQKEFLDRKHTSISWRKLSNGRAETGAAQPSEVPVLYDQAQVPEMPDIRSLPRSWKVRTAGGEIRAGEYGNPGLYRIKPGSEPVKIKDGQYDTPMVTGDGRWAIASKYVEEPKEWNGLVRVNLQTGREYRFALPQADSLVPIAFVASLNKVLISADSSDEDDGATGRAAATGGYYLVDAVTGAIQRVKGEFRPLEHQTYRPLQSTGVPGEHWAAIYDPKTNSTNIGRYTDKTFSFKPVLNLPSINLDSMAIWVDEPAGKVYFIYEGHLLSTPVKQLY